MKRSEYNKIKQEGLELMRKSGLYLTAEEEERMEVTDFGLNDPYHEGLMLHVYVNTKRCCAKELPMLPGQICAEHRHPPLGPEIRERRRHSAADMERYIFMSRESRP